MTYRKNITAGLVLIAALTGSACKRVDPTSQAAMPGQPIDFALPVEITEDHPRWDCRTMGDKVCGKHACDSVTKSGKPCRRRVREAGLMCWQHSREYNNPKTRAAYLARQK